MTWGQLRLLVQAEFPSVVSADLLDGALNSRYEQVLEAADWTGLREHAILQTQAAYQSSTDTATLTLGSNAVTGVGTAWTAGYVGWRFYVPGDTVIYSVVTVPGVGSLTLDRAYEGNGYDAPGTVYTLKPYVFMQHIYALPADCDSLVTVLDPVTMLPMQKFSKDGLDRSYGPRTFLNDPLSYCTYDDSPETAPPVLHQIEFAPPPVRSRGIPIEYQREIVFFDGTNTSLSPLPFVSGTVLLYGARADLAASGGELAKAKLYEAKFQEELAKLLRKEMAARKKPKLMMDDRFTRHRIARAGRGLNRYWGPGQGGPN